MNVAELWCARCSKNWSNHCIEWPAILVICPYCQRSYCLEAYDPKMGTTVYRPNKPKSHD